MDLLTFSARYVKASMELDKELKAMEKANNKKKDDENKEDKDTE
jgi:hypothetical protein